jgi:hypothetical protein
MQQHRTVGTQKTCKKHDGGKKVRRIQILAGRKQIKTHDKFQKQSQHQNKYT